MIRTNVAGPARISAPRIARILLPALVAIALLASTPHGAAAQARGGKPGAWEFLTSSGGVVPAGAQRRSLDDGALSTVQLSRVVRPALALTATVGWARTHDLEATGRPALDLWSGDLGAEARGTRWGAEGGLTLRPFATVGAGARRYDSRDAGAAVRTRLAGYAGAGAEMGVRRVRVRLETRDYVTSGHAIAGSDAAGARHELALTAGVRWVAR